MATQNLKAMAGESLSLWKNVLSPYEKKEPLLFRAFEVERKRSDAALAFVEKIIAFIVFLIVLFVGILPILSGTVFKLDYLEYWGNVFSNMDPFFFGAMGIAFCIAGSVIGATWGISLSGSGIMGASILHPRVIGKNLISVVFCEAVGVYGVILGTILISKYTFIYDVSNLDGGVLPPLKDLQVRGSGFALFGAGVCTGVGNLLAGMSIGMVGSSTVIADAANSSLFVRMLVVEILLEAVAIFSLVVGIAFQFKCDFNLSTAASS